MTGALARLRFIFVGRVCSAVCWRSSVQKSGLRLPPGYERDWLFRSGENEIDAPHNEDATG